MIVLKIVIAAGFLLAGMAKLVGAKPIVAQFEEFGLPIVVMRGIGMLEILGAIGLFIPALSNWALVGLSLLMVGAIYNHFKVKHPLGQSAPAITLLLLCVVTMIMQI